MPKYKLPPLKKRDEDEDVTIPSSLEESPWQRRITLPVNNAILDVTEVGEKASVMIRGEVLTKRKVEEQGGYERDEKNIEIEISEIEVYPDGYEDETDMEEGFTS